jgi:hypothetical protein
MSISLVDISEIFWTIAVNIATLEYKQLRETPTFNELISYIENEDQFTITIDNTVLQFEDANELFYGVLEFCNVFNLQQAYLMRVVIEKIETYVKMDEIHDLFGSFSI